MQELHSSDYTTAVLDIYYSSQGSTGTLAQQFIYLRK